MKPNKAKDGELIRAVIMGDDMKVRIALSGGADPRCDNSEPLNWAVKCGHSRVVNTLFLLPEKINRPVLSDLRKESLQAAILQNHAEVLLRLMKEGLVIDPSDIEKVLAVGLIKNNWALVSELFEISQQNQNKSVQKEYLITKSLGMACSHGALSMVPDIMLHTANPEEVVKKVGRVVISEMVRSIKTIYDAAVINCLIHNSDASYLKPLLRDAGRLILHVEEVFVKLPELKQQVLLEIIRKDPYLMRAAENTKNIKPLLSKLCLKEGINKIPTSRSVVRKL